PLASAIVNHLKEDKISGLNLDNYESITGKGVKAEFSGREYFAGSSKLMIGMGLPVSAIDIKDWKSRGTVIYFSDKNEILAVIAIEDKIKADSKEGIASLQASGIEVYML